MRTRLIYPILLGGFAVLLASCTSKIEPKDDPPGKDLLVVKEKPAPKEAPPVKDILVAKENPTPKDSPLAKPDPREVTLFVDGMTERLNLV